MIYEVCDTTGDRTRVTAIGPAHAVIRIIRERSVIRFRGRSILPDRRHVWCFDEVDLDGRLLRSMKLTVFMVGPVQPPTLSIPESVVRTSRKARTPQGPPSEGCQARSDAHEEAS